MWQRREGLRRTRRQESLVEDSGDDRSIKFERVRIGQCLCRERGEGTLPRSDRLQGSSPRVRVPRRQGGERGEQENSSVTENEESEGLVLRRTTLRGQGSGLKHAVHLSRFPVHPGLPWEHEQALSERARGYRGSGGLACREKGSVGNMGLKREPGEGTGPSTWWSAQEGVLPAWAVGA